MNLEWGVMQDGVEGLHRGPWTRREAENWVQDCEDMGFRPGAFYVVRRLVGPWAPPVTFTITDNDRRII